MAHFAKLDGNNIVTEVIVVANEDAPTEDIGIAWIIKWCKAAHLNWKQTSYNNNIRKQYAGIGYSYDPVDDVFVAPQPFPSWVLNEQSCQWESPVPMPVDGKMYRWDEAKKAWDVQLAN